MLLVLHDDFSYGAVGKAHDVDTAVEGIHTSAIDGVELLGRRSGRFGHREDDFRGFVQELDSRKPVIICGDMNVAHQEIDLKNPKPNRGKAGFSDEERGKMTELLGAGFTDTFRYLYPDVTGVYSWWSYRFNARKNNAGWRIDYFLVSDRLRDNIKEAKIHTDILGSDHCPVELEVKL